MFIIALNAIIDLIQPQYSPTEASSYLPINTYIDGKNQITHPSVIAFENTWNGYKYWFAYTPYPFGNGGEENPSIAVSNDLISWLTPNGLFNPIANNEEVACDELKDSHILYRPDLDRIEIWYMGRLNSTIANGGDLLMFRKYSHDGIVWSDFEVMKIMNGTLSPSIIYEDDRYKLWSIVPSKNGKEIDGQLLYAESEDGFNWSEYRNCEFGNKNNLSIWHGSVSKDDDGFHFVWIEDSGNSNIINYAYSIDGVNFSTPKSIIEKAAAWKAYYRPHLLKAEDQFNLFYGVITYENEWHIALSQGRSIDTLFGYNDGIKQHTNYYARIIKNVIKSLNQYFRIELIAILLLFCFVFLILVKGNPFATLWALCWIIALAYSYLRYGIGQPMDYAYMLCSCGIIGLLCSSTATQIFHTKPKDK